MDFFIEGKGGNYLYLKDIIENDNKAYSNKNDFIDIVDIYKFNFSIKENDDKIINTYIEDEKNSNKLQIF